MNKETELTTMVDLIRHGEPVGGRKYRGQLDDPLSEKGWQQMRDAIGDHKPWDIIVTSTLRRCREFAEELSQRHDLPLHKEPRFMEIGFGEWEGRTAEELMEEDPQRLHKFWSDPLNNTPPGAETLIVFHDRVIAAWKEMLAQHTGKQILVVGHAGMMRMVLRHVLDMPLDRMYRIQVGLGEITRIHINGSGKKSLPRMIFHGSKL